MGPGTPSVTGLPMDSSHKDLFDFCAKNNLWQYGAIKEGLGESMSGIGSHKIYTRRFVSHVNRIIEEKQIKTIFDASCGDWNWMRDVNLNGIEYVGNDISSVVIEHNKDKYDDAENVHFLCGDCLEHLQEKKNNSYDLCVLRQTLEHLSNEDCIDIVSEVKRTSRYAIITSGTPSETSNSRDFVCDGVSSRTITLDMSPFVQILGHPSERFDDGHEELTVSNCFGYLYDWSKE